MNAPDVRRWIRAPEGRGTPPTLDQAVEEDDGFAPTAPPPRPSPAPKADRKSTRLNSSHSQQSRMPSSA